jgi:hypothetical protein
MRGEVEGDPVVDRLPTDTGKGSHFIEGSPLGYQQYGLHTLKRAFIGSALQRFLEPQLIVTIEAKFGWPLCCSHESSVYLMLYFSKNVC